MKKIMFNDKYGLTTAVIEGRKTMTRRVITIPEKWHGIEVYGFCHVKGQAALELTDGDDFCIEDPRTGQCAQIMPTYKIGEEVAIAQCYEEAHKAFAESQLFYLGYYTDVENAHQKLWEDIQGVHNKMFVRADLMPHRIRITDIKVERLQDISDEDAMREGIRQSVIEYGDKKIVQWTYFGAKITTWFDSPREAFAALIDRISGRGTWEENPWVFAYEFELVK